METESPDQCYLSSISADLNRRVAADIKILFNDWPYGLDEKIVHLVVWTKFDLEDDPATDDLTPGARKAIDAFVNATFCSRVTPDHVRFACFKSKRLLTNSN